MLKVINREIWELYISLVKYKWGVEEFYNYVDGCIVAYQAPIYEEKLKNDWVFKTKLKGYIVGEER